MHSHEKKKIEHLSSNKRSLLDKYLAKEQPDTRIARRTISGPVPLSFSQQRLWFLDRLIPDSPLYNVFNLLRFTFPVNTEVLQKSLHEIARRHESLRTHFTTIDGQPMQMVEPVSYIYVPIIDIRGMPEADRQTELQRLTNEEAQKPFDLMQGPLLRVTLIRIADQDYVFTIAMHHIITDGWSMNIFFKELSTLYEAYSRGLPSPLPELPIQFPDFALWQRHWLQGKILEEQLTYWGNKLSDINPMELPTDFPRSSVQTFRGAAKAFKFPGELYQVIRRVCQEHSCTMFMALLAVFKIMVFRLTGQHDIAVGSPISGRNRTEIEGLIGFFVNVVVMRTQLSGEESFHQVLKMVKTTALEAYSHQDLPFEMLVEELQPNRDLSHNPLFQVMFQVVSGQPFDSSQEEDLSMPQILVETAKFDLTISFNDGPKTLTGSIEYNTDLFKGQTIDRYITIFQTLLQQVIAQPYQPVRSFSLISPEERNRVLERWNATQTDCPRYQTIPALFKKAANHYPNALAVSYGSQHLTYAELDQQSDQLATYLVKRGMITEQLVGVCLERSISLVVTLLGILKAGGAYVPLDPSYPRERIHAMVGDARLAWILTEDAYAHLLPASSSVIILSREWEKIKQAPRTPLAPDVQSGHLAYVMYTSGSTGQPKGIEVPHRAVIRLLFNTNYISIEPGDTFAQGSNTSFDASVFEIWGALLQGAHLVIVPPEYSMAPVRYAALIEEKGINTIFLTTALLNQFAQQAPWAFRSLRQLFFGGETVTPLWVREILLNSPLQRLVHVYGPTENTTFSSWFEVRTVSQSDMTVPIGQPISNTYLYVLDHQLEPVPMGIPGELYIGGEGLARGYLHRPALTATCFLPDPFTTEPGARMYRTGDMVRMNEGGDLEFMGRKDRQVKLRGFRIELEEIEWNLQQHPLVQDCLIHVWDELPDDKRIVAYLTVKSPDTLTPATVRQYIRERLPEYMVPSAFMILPHFPLNPNGKIDFNKLPRPAGEQAVKSPLSHVEPRTPTEKVIGDIWKEVLQLSEIDIYDNFFDLGGHSLLIAKVHTRLNEHYKSDIPLIALFQFPTIYHLSQHLGELPGQVEEVSHHDLQHITDRISKQKKALIMSKKNKPKFK